ncbi:hypothetical protein [Xenophilus sp. Marseille-Q4582]|uniref:hypothetical protein n=1 Tax=Xenophilus sp. Marseille-Q4582 TaxID=2866600 RepID=UPI001CE3CDDD|nr:hypothetical protein [Xenophilus sp. Marseille-Q4582]
MAEAIRTIHLDQPLPAEIPARAAQPISLYSWFRLPSGQIVELRKITGDRNPEVVVRNVNFDGEMAAGEYSLTLRFLRTRCELVAK